MFFAACAVCVGVAVALELYFAPQADGVEEESPRDAISLGALPVHCPRCHQRMEHVSVVPHFSNVYRCPTDGYWRMDISGCVERIRYR